MSPPLVSVLMPCFNAGRYVGAAIESVLAQTYKPLEIIAVDDGSDDGSRSIIETFADRGVTGIFQANAGAAAARNRAFAAAKGEFVLFLDADDIVAPDHIAALVARIGEERDCIAMAQWDRFRHEPEEAGFPDRPAYRDRAGPEWLALDWTNGQPMTQSGMFLIPRSLLERVGGWDERLSLTDDFEFFARVIGASAGIRFTPDARLYYRSGLPGSLSGRKSRKAAESACLSLLEGTNHLLAAENSPRTRLACANVLMTFEYGFYPEFPDLRAKVRARVAELGGATLPPDGPPRFHTLRKFIGWRAARRVQHFAEQLGVNRASRPSRAGCSS